MNVSGFILYHCPPCPLIFNEIGLFFSVLGTLLALSELRAFADVVSSSQNTVLLALWMILQVPP